MNYFKYKRNKTSPLPQSSSLIRWISAFAFLLLILLSVLFDRTRTLPSPRSVYTPTLNLILFIRYSTPRCQGSVYISRCIFRNKKKRLIDDDSVLVGSAGRDRWSVKVFVKTVVGALMTKGFFLVFFLLWWGILWRGKAILSRIQNVQDSLDQRVGGLILFVFLAENFDVSQLAEIEVTLLLQSLQV